MAAVENWLLCNRLRALAGPIVSGADEASAANAWHEMEDALEQAGASENADLALPVLVRDRDALQALFDGWDKGTAALPEWDKAVLKRALKAYRKRLKLMRLDDESTASKNPLSKGETSHILGVKPPEQYPQEIWDMLVAQGKLREAGFGLLELATT